MSSDNQLRGILEAITKNIDDDMDDFTPLKSVCDKYQVKPSIVVMAIVGIILIFTILGVFQHIFVTLFGLLYPAYMSFKVSLSPLRPSTKSPKNNLKFGWLIGSSSASSLLSINCSVSSSSSFQATTSSYVFSTSGCSIRGPREPRLFTIPS